MTRNSQLTPAELREEAAEIRRAAALLRRRSEEARDLSRVAREAVARREAEAQTRSIRARALAALNGTPYALAVVLAVGSLALLAASFVADAEAAPTPRAVALADAHTPPAYLEYLAPGEGRTMDPRGVAVESSAYRWNGAALEAQRWNRDHDRLTWPDPRGGRVIFDGRRFYNGTRRPVLVALWFDGRPYATTPARRAAVVAPHSHSLALAFLVIGGLVGFTVGGSWMAAARADRRAS